jgi:glycopeptide antibiotics resistance protein
MTSSILPRSTVAKLASPSLILLAAYIGGVFLFHSLPTRNFPLTGKMGWFEVTEILHFALFFPWGWMTAHVISRSPARMVGAAVSVWLLLGLMVAALAEGAQILLEHRSFNWRDMFFNVVGIGAGAMMVLLARGGSVLRRWAGPRVGEKSVVHHSSR